MKFKAFIHNDDKKCFHVVVQKTHKFVMMGRINYKDHVLIKRWQASKKMNATSEKLKDKKNEVIVESCFRLLLEVMRIFEISEFTATRV
jgi:acyl CoA:acetate/3-ketoacid CoA transferase alpha subunit